VLYGCLDEGGLMEKWADAPDFTAWTNYASKTNIMGYYVKIGNSTGVFGGTVRLVA